MELRSCLWNEVDTFEFRREDLDPLLEAIPQLELHFHDSIDSFLDQCGTAKFALVWDFQSDWYSRCPDLDVILAPAAGNDWVEPDP